MFSFPCKAEPPYSSKGTGGILPAILSLSHQLTNRTPAQSTSPGLTQNAAIGNNPWRFPVPDGNCLS